MNSLSLLLVLKLIPSLYSKQREYSFARPVDIPKNNCTERGKNKTKIRPRQG
jgi:hypothetical protein